MGAVITSIDQGSPASSARISVGDTLETINGHDIKDVLDYKYYSYDEKLHLTVTDGRGRTHRIRIRKEAGEDIGLGFTTYLMDEAKCCANRCMFCFVDQLPKGMRSTLYFKDDDARLSFLQGNYITLTNMSEEEVQRIIDMRVSPINVSVHTTDPELRCRMLGSKNARVGLEYMRRFSEAGITMNCQIVCCPGINDGIQLDKTMIDLADMYPSVNSVSIVPVGLTKHRENLYKLTPFDKEKACTVIDQVEAFGRRCDERFGTRIFFCADELYIKAGRELPGDEFYEGYPQLENGVGMMRLLITEFFDALEYAPENRRVKFSIATGVSAAKFLAPLISAADEKLGNVTGNVYPIVNYFFGETIDVAGLVTGRDIISQLAGKELGERLLIPRNMLRHGEGIFLDDVLTDDIEQTLGVRVRVVEQDGGDLLRAMLGY